MTSSVKSAPVAKNWTEATAAIAVEMYAEAKYDNAKLAEIGVALGKTANMIRAKLVNMGEYVKVEASASESVGSSPVRKLTIVRQISAIVGSSELTSLVKGSKADLETLQKAIIALAPKPEKVEETEVEVETEV
jgi:hypothetical protein